MRMNFNKLKISLIYIEFRNEYGKNSFNSPVNPLLSDPVLSGEFPKSSIKRT